MKISLTLALSFMATVFCFGQTMETAPSPTPAEAAEEAEATPDAQKKEADNATGTTAAPAEAAAPEATAKAAAPAAAKKAAKPAGAATAATMSPHMGTWKLNEAKSKLAPGEGKNTTVKYSAAANGMTKVTVEGVDKAGKPTKGVWLGKFDGKAYAVKGNPGYDQFMYKVVNARTNDITAMKGGKVVWTGKIAVAKDGKSRVVTIKGTDAAGKKVKSKAVYDKE